MKENVYTLKINDVQFHELDEASSRQRATLARTAIDMKMDGPKKSAKFGFLLNGEYISASVLLNMHTKFSKLQVGKHMVCAKQTNSSGNQLFPLSIALNGLLSLHKV